MRFPRPAFIPREKQNSFFFYKPLCLEDYKDDFILHQDTLRDKCDTHPDCVKNCCLYPFVAPIFFVVFVLMAQFVLVNVVVAVLMKHLEESHKLVRELSYVCFPSLYTRLQLSTSEQEEVDSASRVHCCKLYIRQTRAMSINLFTVSGSNVRHALTP